MEEQITKIPKTATNAIIAVSVLIGASITPIIPEEMDLQYSFQYDVGAVEIEKQNSQNSSTTKDFFGTNFDDDDGNGVVSVSVFSDKNGDFVYAQIDDSQYEQMGKKDGYAKNPKKDEFISLSEFFTPKVEAAIAFDATTASILTGSGATSITFAHTVTGTDTFLIVSATTLNWTAGAPSSVSATYNGVSMTVVAQNVQVFNTNNWRTHQLYLAGASTGSNNVVVSTGSGSGRIKGVAYSYTGVDQTSPILASNTASAPTSGNTMSISLTTAEAGWWFISGTNVDANWTAGANTGTIRDASSISGGADSNGDISAQTGNAQMSHTGTRGYGGVAVAFKAVAAAAERRIINMTQY